MEFLSFNDSLANEFSQMNLAWVKKYFEVEPADKLVLSNPRRNIIDKGGYIFFAKSGDTIAGTFALLRVNDQEFELSKMAVKEAFLGKNIGNALLTFCLQEAKKLGIKKLVLYSNTKLGPAIHLYMKYGFLQVPLNNSAYKRSDIKMELELKY